MEYHEIWKSDWQSLINHTRFIKTGHKKGSTHTYGQRFIMVY